LKLFTLLSIIAVFNMASGEDTIQFRSRLEGVRVDPPLQLLSYVDPVDPTLPLLLALISRSAFSFEELASVSFVLT